MKIPMIALTAVEIGAQSPFIKDAITYGRRWLGKTIAGTSTTRKDFKELKNSIDELRDLIKSEKEMCNETTDKLDNSTVRNNPICDQPRQEGEMETGPSKGNFKEPWSGI